MNLDRLTEEYVKQKEFLGKATKKVDELKDMLVKAVDDEGQVDPDKGHKVIQTQNWELTRQRRVSPHFNVAKAEAWAKSIGEDFTTTVTHSVFDQDKMLAWVFDHPEYEPVYKSFMEETVTWAFQPPKPKQDIDY